MIKLRELYIGCWYNIKNPMSGDLSPEQFTNWTQALDFEAYGTPIELTPDWLWKLGFFKEKTNDIEENELWSIQVANITSLYYQPDSGGNDWYLANEWNNNHVKGDFWANPKYVHQVMNLVYSLTEEELTIKTT